MILVFGEDLALVSHDEDIVLNELLDDGLLALEHGQLLLHLLDLLGELVHSGGFGLELFLLGFLELLLGLDFLMGSSSGRTGFEHIHGLAPLLWF